MAEESFEQVAEKKISFTEKIRENPWVLSTLVLGAVVLLLLFLNFKGGITGNVISADDASERLLDYYTQGGADGLELDSVVEENGLYKINFKYQGAIVPIYMTKDGSMAGSMTALVRQTISEEQNEEVPKTDKPKVELFVMTYCPYGTQAEKGFIPFIEAIGNLVDAKIRFVHYFMHGDTEEQETYTQVCIREEQSSKYLVYLREFLVEGNSEAALKKAGIDSVKLNDCIDKKAKDYYAEDSELSEKYGVQGSPTLIINGAIISSGRSPASYLSAVCSAFNTSPSECTSLELDSSNPSPMWGWEISSSSSTASCS